MKRITSWCVLFLVATATLALAQGGAGEKAVTDLEKQWLKGQQTNNVALIEPLLAEGFVNTDSEGKFEGRAEMIAGQSDQVYERRLRGPEGEDLRQHRGGDWDV